MSTTPTPDKTFPDKYVIQRDNEIAAWLNEITLLTSELLADIDHHYDHSELEQQVLHLHSRLWAMRQTFGFGVEPTKDGES